VNGTDEHALVRGTLDPLLDDFSIGREDQESDN